MIFLFLLLLRIWFSGYDGCIYSPIIVTFLVENLRVIFHGLYKIFLFLKNQLHVTKFKLTLKTW